MLHALKDYAIRQGLTAEPGLKPKTIRWLLVFSREGRFLGVQDLAGGDRRSKGREFPACPDLTQQEMVAAGGCCRHFLVDGLDVACLLTKDGQVSETLAAKHDYFANLLDQAKECLPVLGPTAAALRDGETLQAIRAKLAEGKAKPTDLATLAVMGQEGVTIPVEGGRWHEWWQGRRRRMAEARQSKTGAGRKKAAAQPANRMLCLLSGDLVEPLATHNKIERLSDVGGLAMGDSLVSFDKEAFTSFGLEQGANAAMSETMVKTYVTALNYLIRHQSRRLAGVKVVYWYSGRIDPKDDPVPEIFEGLGPPSEDEPGDVREQSAAQIADRARAESTAARLLNAIRSGERADLGDYRYYALTISANSGRVVIRDWMEGQFTELLEAVKAWFEDLSIIRRDGRRIEAAHKFGAVLAAPVRELGDAPAPLVATLWRCALRKEQPIPHQVMAQTLQRVRLDVIGGETPLHARLGLLKAYCNRNERTPKMNPELNDLENDPAYLCGRIMAILANIQYAALGDVGAGVVQRYYAAASATPALVLGRLVRLALTGHLPKIEAKGLRVWFDKQLAEVWARLTRRPPATLSLQEQTLFAMGYYQQMAKRYETGKNDAKQGAEAPAA
jgi:CRISPR-associated protein Csd1